jgi:hypothetical protein
MRCHWMKFIHFIVQLKMIFNYNSQCHSQLKWFEMVIDVVLTRG